MGKRKKIFIVRTSSLEAEDLLEARIKELDQSGWEIIFHPKPQDPHWPFCAASAADRTGQLEEALFDSHSSIIWCARGGYGASDLLPRLNWQKLRELKEPKLVIGFSDISALHSAFYTILGWPALHAPMPATTLWRGSQDQQDINLTLEGLRSGHWRVKFEVSNVRKESAPSIEGRLFGGCMSVLSALIGTPYFPHNLANHIVFLEDTGENPGRLTRYLNQWIQSGKLTGVKALVLGSFRDSVQAGDEMRFIYQQFANRTGIPTFYSGLFGHTSPNYPLMVGANATIEDGHLYWSAAPSSVPFSEV